MTRGLLAFALAFVIVGGPLAADVCEAVCAEHAGHSIASTLPVSHHHRTADAAKRPLHHSPSTSAAPATQSTVFMLPPHECDYLEAIITDSREVTPAPLVRVLVMTAGVPVLPVRVSAVFEMESRHGPPVRIRSTSPLRI